MTEGDDTRLTGWTLIRTGVSVGMTAAMWGSLCFAAIIVSIVATRFGSSPGDIWVSLILWVLGILYGLLFCCLYSIVPGMLGGIFLAWWLSNRQTRSRLELTLRGGIVGGVSGLVCVILFALTQGSYGREIFSVYSPMILQPILAMLVAGGAGVWGAVQLQPANQRPDAQAQTATAGGTE